MATAVGMATPTSGCAVLRATTTTPLMPGPSTVSEPESLPHELGSTLNGAIVRVTQEPQWLWASTRGSSTDARKGFRPGGPGLPERRLEGLELLYKAPA